MQKKITLLLIMATVITTSIFANPVSNIVNGKVLTTFSSKFEGATEVSWKQTDHYLQANFVINNQPMSAFFNESGEMIGAVKNILSQQLPITLNTELKKLTANNWISELFEFTDGQETTYFVTLENGDQKLHLKSAGSTDWSVYRKMKKN